MKRLLPSALAVLVVGAGAIYGYRWMTHLDRMIDRLVHFGYLALEPGDLEHLTARAAEPKAQVAAALIATKSLSGCASGAEGKRRLDALDAVFTKQPLSAEYGAAIVATVLSACADERARGWGKFDDEALVAGTLRALREGLHLGNAEPIVAWVEDLHPQVSATLIDVIGLAIGSSSRADAHFQRGFPEDGAPFAENGPTLPPATDARVVHAVTGAILQFNAISPPLTVLPALARVTEQVKVTPSDEVIGALIRMGSSDAALSVDANVLSANDLARVRGKGEAWSAAIVAAIANRFGQMSSGDIAAVLTRIRQEVRDDDPQRNEAIRRTVPMAVSQLVRIGPRALPVVVAGLKDDHFAVRDACVEALFQLDRPHFVERLFQAAPGLSLGDIEHAKRLLGPAAVATEPRIFLMSLSYPTLAAAAGAELKKALPQGALVPALFAFIAERSGFSRDEVNTYRRLLEGYSASGAPTARVLEDALAQAGAPERVYWLAKLLALEHLARVGGRGERATVAKFLADRSGYEDVTTIYKGQSGQVVKREATPQSFSALAQRALDAIDRR